MKISKKNKGLTLIEILVVTVLMFFVLSIITSSLWSFMNYSSRNALEDQAQYDINIILRKIDNDIQSSNKIFSSVTATINGVSKTWNTDKDTIILSEPLLTEYGMPVVNSSGNQVFDTFILDKDGENLRYIVIPSAGSTRKSINKIIYKNINITNNENLFKYFKTSTSEIEESSIVTEIEKTKLVKYYISTQVEYKKKTTLIKRYSQAKLLNFGI